MSQVIEFKLAGREIREIPLADFKPSPPREGVFYWYDLTLTDPKTLLPLLDQIGIQPDILEKFHSERTVPHLEELEKSLTIYAPTLSGLTDWRGEPQIARCLIYLTENFFLSLSAGPVPVLETLRKNFRKEFQHAQSPGFLFFLFFDEKINTWGERLSQLEESADQIEEGLHEAFDSQVNERIFQLKKRILLAKKFLSAERDILMRVSGKKMTMITEEGRKSLGDLYAHAQNLSTSLDLIRELLSAALESSMSVLSQKLNETMKVLTTFATIILPISLIPALYGTNFSSIPLLQWKYGFWLCLGLMVAVGGLVVCYFRRKKWL